MSDSDYTNVLLEDMNGKFDAIMEYVSEIPEMKTRLTGVETRLTGVETRLAGVEGHVSNIEDRLDNVEEEQRLTRVAILEELHDVESLKRIHPGLTH